MMAVSCPGCGEVLQLSEQVAGLPVRCRHCRHEFTAPEAVVELSPASAPAPRWPADERIDSPRRPSRKRRPILLTCGIIAGVVVLACGGLGTLIYVLFIHETEEPVTRADRELVVTAEHLKEFLPTLQFDANHGTLRKVRHLDGSRELTYEYDPAEEEHVTLYVSHSVGVERSARDARYSYAGMDIGTKLGLRLQGGGQIRQLDRSDLWRWGDESKCVLLMNGDKKVGNIFTGRKGRRYFTLMIIGIYFEEAQPIHELLDAILQKLDSYEG